MLRENGKVFRFNFAIAVMIFSFFSSAGYAQKSPATKTSYDYYSEAEFEKAFGAITKEIETVPEEAVESILDMSLDVFAQTESLKLADLMKIYEQAQKRSFNSYIQKRIANEKKVLQEWPDLKKLSAKDLTKKIDAAIKMKDPITDPNHEKKARLRIYSYVAKSQTKNENPEWMLVQAKAQYGLSKGGLQLLQQIKEQKKVPKDVLKEVDGFIKKIESR